MAVVVESAIYHVNILVCHVIFSTVYHADVTVLIT